MLQSIRPRERPAHAIRTKVVTRGTVQAPYDRLTAGDGEAAGGDQDTQREGAASHSLTARAVTGHGQQGWSIDGHAQPVAAATGLPGLLPIDHNDSPYVRRRFVP